MHTAPPHTAAYLPMQSSNAIKAACKYHPALLCRQYLDSPEHVAGFSHFIDAYLSKLHDPNVAVRRGYALALGALPSWVLAPRLEEVCVCV